MSCPNAMMVLEVLDHKEQRHRFIQARCKRWTCPHCGKINSRNLGRLVGEAVQAYMDQIPVNSAKRRYLVKLVTLTVPGSEYRNRVGAADAHSYLKKSLDVLLKAIRRSAGAVEYLWVCEEQADGYPHIHLLLMGPGIAGKWIMRFINDVWTCLGMGRSSVEMVRDVGGVGRYLAKYLSKEKSKADQKGKRVWSISRRLRAMVKEKRELSSERYQVVAVYARNADGSRGSCLWRVGDAMTIMEVLEASHLKQCLEFFSQCRIDRHQQILLFDPE